MPNGWNPVPGLDVLHVQRTEQRHPHHDWSCGDRRAWAIRVDGPRGLTPAATRPPVGAGFSSVVWAAQALTEPQLFVASAVDLDLAMRRGYACGAFVAYGFRQGSVTCLHDHGVLAQHGPRGTLTADQRRALEESEEVRRWAGVPVSGIDHQGLRLELPGVPADADEDTRIAACAFSFRGCDGLVVSSVPLHLDPHWPPASMLDVPAVALASEERSDLLLMLWTAPP